MTVLSKLPNRYEEGAYGVVFFDEYDCAVKLFKRRASAPEEHIRAVFQSEVEAYMIATQSEELRVLVPEFFGAIQCEKVLDETGKDISHEFHLSIGYKMRKIDGEFIKSGLQELILKSAFKKAGIHHTVDASILYDEDGLVKCMVDIATREFELWHS